MSISRIFMGAFVLIPSGLNKMKEFYFHYNNEDMNRNKNHFHLEKVDGTSATSNNNILTME